ncbi:DVU_1556 family methyltransferase [Pelosinus baikalensis]|uniref:Methyltransferase domain-containing protein n=1 Tax=Pelosinus baikalensis TaxID=2892015 RepID=A0ABS8HM58_9FIRM|nr:class I SAM-dependent methyltransferase [Pelosinus baikalensis]MCC5464287.1 methyltransferase domain-containing protein [Pelosinus baikalensis]
MMGQHNDRITTDLHECSSNVFENKIFANMAEGARPGGLQLTRRLIDYCNFDHRSIVVDMGCGTGTTVEYLRDVRGVYALGVDLSTPLLQQGKERKPDLRLIQSPGADMPFADHSIDGVLAECSLSVMPDISKVLIEINRILVSGGKLAITDLYIREGDSDVPSIMTHSDLFQILQKHDFNILIFEDQTAFLKEFVASFIMEHGSIEDLWQCTGKKKLDKKIPGLGYYLLIAEKGS